MAEVKNQCHGVAGSQSGFPKETFLPLNVHVCMAELGLGIKCVFITAGPITKLTNPIRVGNVCVEMLAEW